MKTVTFRKVGWMPVSSLNLSYFPMKPTRKEVVQYLSWKAPGAKMKIVRCMEIITYRQIKPKKIKD